jgi:hypothetical protein
MTHPTLDHEERLRSALRAAADSIEPAADGLGRIRARLTPPRPVIAAWMVSWAEPVMLRLRLAVPWLRLRLGLAHGRIGPVAGRARPALGQLGTLFGGTGTAPIPIRPASGKLPVRAAAWLRPAAAIAAFVVIIGSGALAIGQLQQTATLARRAAASSHSGRQPNSVRGGGGRADADGARQLKNPWLKSPGWPLAPADSKFSMSLLAPIPLPAGPAPSSTCPPSPKPSASPSSSPTSTPTATPTPTGSVSPSPSPPPTSPPVSPSPPATSPPVSPSPGATAMPTSSAAPSGAPAASVNTVAYVVGPVSGSAASSSPATNKSACAPTGQ